MNIHVPFMTSTKLDAHESMDVSFFATYEEEIDMSNWKVGDDFIPPTFGHRLLAGNQIRPHELEHTIIFPDLSKMIKKANEDKYNYVGGEENESI